MFVVYPVNSYFKKIKFGFWRCFPALERGSFTLRSPFFQRRIDKASGGGRSEGGKIKHIGQGERQGEQYFNHSQKGPHNLTDWT